MSKDYEKNLEPYWQKGGTYALPVEIVNIILGELDDLKIQNKYLLALQKDMDKQYEKLENVIYEVRDYVQDNLNFCLKDSQEIYGICNSTIKKYRKILEILDKGEFKND